MKNAISMILAAGLLASCTAPESDSAAAAESDGASAIGTQVLTLDEAEKASEEWGEFVKYYEGETRGTRELLSGTAEIKPGMEIHPPHTHAEEEFLMVLEGQGEWTVGTETFAAKTGDMLYAAPWDSHGIKNTGDTTLKFVFWKWNSKGMETPPEPK